jgi:hemolysin activation/secretion protein
LSLQLGTTEGLNDATINYSVPVSARDALLSFSLSRSESAIIEEPFDQINITSQTDSVSIKYEHPLFQSLNGYFNLSLGIDKRKSKSLLDGEPFEFSPGAKNGVANVTVIRLGQAWLKKTQNRVLAINTRISIGLNELDATQNADDTPDGGFTNLFTQLQWVQRFKKFNLIMRAETQRSNDQLLSLEKFGLGGSRSVRGYRENLFVRDEGWLGSIEARIPIRDEKFQLAIFYEGGAAENLNKKSTSETLASAGLGIHWNPISGIQIQGYWGAALKEVELGSNSHLQDDGVHFSIDYVF